jgi:hypothetical protein
MRRITICIAAALLALAASAAPASAKVRSRVLTVGQDFSIAGKTVSAGTYRFSFDDEKNELTVSDRKTKEVVARAEARAEKWERGSNSLPLQFKGDSAPLSFEGITFDSKQIVRVSSPASQGK